jgi:hypothetical protein
MRTGPLLASDLVDKYQPLGAFGQPVYLSYVQLHATIRQKLGARHANYFARPDRDPQNKSVHWVSEVPGTAVRWNDLPAEDQTRYAIDLEAMRSDFHRYLGDLRQLGGRQDGTNPPEGKGAAAFASLLEQALLVPDDSHLYFVGDQPVVSFWGFRNFDAQGFDALSVAPRKPPAAATAAGAPAAAANAGSGITVPFEPAPRRPWWRWLLWALALLLLLLLLLFGLSRCFPEDIQLPIIDDVVPKDEHVVPVMPGETEKLAPDGHEEGLFDRSLRYLGLGDQQPGGDIVTPPGTDQVAPPGDQPLPGPGDALKPGEDLKPDEGLKPGNDATPPEQPPAEPPVPPDGKPPAEDQALPQPPKPLPSDAPSSSQDQQAVPPVPAPDQQAGPKGQPMQIPPDAKTGSPGFIGGEWSTDSGLVDQATKQPLKQTYQFDDKGAGEVVIRRPDGIECRAPAQARMQGGKLSIDEMGNPTCPDGRSYSRSKTECSRTPSGQTVCLGRNADGSTYRVGIERKAPQP